MYVRMYRHTYAYSMYIHMYILLILAIFMYSSFCNHCAIKALIFEDICMWILKFSLKKAYH